MQITRLLALLLWVTSSALAASPCKSLVAQVGFWGISFDTTLEFVSSAPPALDDEALDISPYVGEPHKDLKLRIHRAMIPAMAQRLAMGGDPHPFEKLLTHHLETKGDLIPAKEILPARVAASLGTRNGSPCYEAAYRFHADYHYDDNFVSYLRTNYTTLGRASQLQYGDFVMFWYPPETGGVRSFHGAIYLGGDYLYHKFSPTPVFTHQFNTFETLMPAMAQLANGSHGHRFMMEFLRYDPEHKMPPQIPPQGKSEYGSPIHQRYMTEFHPGIAWTPQMNEPVYLNPRLRPRK